MDRDFGFMQQLPSLQDAVFIDDSVIKIFSNYRDAVLWCWENRPSNRGMNAVAEQSFFCANFGYTPSHFSRCVNRHTKAPMELKPDFIPTFEAWTGNRAVTQYLNSINSITSLEEIQQRRA